MCVWLRFKTHSTGLLAQQVTSLYMEGATEGRDLMGLVLVLDFG